MTTLTQNEVKKEQQRLKDLGLYTGVVDGNWGKLSQTALDAYEAKLIKASQLYTTHKNGELAWGAKVSQTFKERIIWIADSLLMPKDGANWLMACIAWESGESFSASVRNMAGSGATGLIQFMPATAKQLGITTEALALMSAEDQLNYVYKYFQPYKGKLLKLSDVYMAILWPKAIGASDTSTLWSSNGMPTTYRQNSGLDINKDGTITKAEATAKVKGKLDKGLTLQYLG